MHVYIYIIICITFDIKGWGRKEFSSRCSAAGQPHHQRFARLCSSRVMWCWMYPNTLFYSILAPPQTKTLYDDFYSEKCTGNYVDFFALLIQFLWRRPQKFLTQKWKETNKNARKSRKLQRFFECVVPPRSKTGLASGSVCVKIVCFYRRMKTSSMSVVLWTGSSLCTTEAGVSWVKASLSVVYFIFWGEVSIFVRDFYNGSNKLQTNWFRWMEVQSLQGNKLIIQTSRMTDIQNHHICRKQRKASHIAHCQGDDDPRRRCRG